MLSMMNVKEAAGSANLRPPMLHGMHRVRDIPFLRLYMIRDHANATSESRRLKLFRHIFGQLGLERPGTICDKWMDVAKKHKEKIRDLMDPIWVHKIKDGYFVDDGNHRIWLARKLNLLTLKAVEYEWDR